MKKQSYVDNAYNRRVGRVGMEVGTMVISKSVNSSNTNPRTYVDNGMNQRVGRVGMEVGTMVITKSVNDRDTKPRTYVDNAMNRRVGRVGMEVGTMVISKSANNRDTKSRPYVDIERDLHPYRFGAGLELPNHRGDAQYSPWTQTEDHPIPRPSFPRTMDNPCIELPSGIRPAMTPNKQNILVFSPIPNQKSELPRNESTLRGTTFIPMTGLPLPQVPTKALAQSTTLKNDSWGTAVSAFPQQLQATNSLMIDINLHSTGICTSPKLENRMVQAQQIPVQFAIPDTGQVPIMNTRMDKDRANDFPVIDREKVGAKGDPGAVRILPLKKESLDADGQHEEEGGEPTNIGKLEKLPLQNLENLRKQADELKHKEEWKGLMKQDVPQQLREVKEEQAHEKVQLRDELQEIEKERKTLEEFCKDKIDETVNRNTRQNILVEEVDDQQGETKKVNHLLDETLKEPELPRNESTLPGITFTPKTGLALPQSPTKLTADSTTLKNDTWSTTLSVCPEQLHASSSLMINSSQYSTGKNAGPKLENNLIQVQQTPGLFAVPATGLHNMCITSINVKDEVTPICGSGKSIRTMQHGLFPNQLFNKLPQANQQLEQNDGLGREFLGKNLMMPHSASTSDIPVVPQLVGTQPRLEYQQTHVLNTRMENEPANSAPVIDREKVDAKVVLDENGGIVRLPSLKTGSLESDGEHVGEGRETTNMGQFEKLLLENLENFKKHAAELKHKEEWTGLIEQKVPQQLREMKEEQEHERLKLRNELETIEKERKTWEECRKDWEIQRKYLEDKIDDLENINRRQNIVDKEVEDQQVEAVRMTKNCNNTMNPPPPLTNQTPAASPSVLGCKPMEQKPSHSRNESTPTAIFNPLRECNSPLFPIKGSAFCQQHSFTNYLTIKSSSQLHYKDMSSMNVEHEVTRLLCSTIEQIQIANQWLYPEPLINIPEPNQQLRQQHNFLEQRDTLQRGFSGRNLLMPHSLSTSNIQVASQISNLKAGLGLERVEDWKGLIKQEVSKQFRELKEEIEFQKFMFRYELGKVKAEQEKLEERAKVWERQGKDLGDKIIDLENKSRRLDMVNRREKDKQEETWMMAKKLTDVFEEKLKRKAQKLLANREVNSYEQAEIAAVLLELNFDQSEAVEADCESSTLDLAISYLQKECKLCFQLYRTPKMVAMLYCEHQCCQTCAEEYFKKQILNHNVVDIKCPFCNSLSSIDDEEILNEYFARLNILLQDVVTAEVHQLFLQKYQDWTLKLRNVKWCSQCNNGYSINDQNEQILVCQYCDFKICTLCECKWEEQHVGISCVQFATWKNDSNTEFQKEGSEKHLVKHGIKCPKCNCKYSLERGDYMHFMCIQCKFEFCSGCRQPFHMSQKCNISSHCEKLGLHAHHPRNCLFYLRDKEPNVLQKLLDDLCVPYDTKSSQNNKCHVNLAVETTKGIDDRLCGKDVGQKYAGMCRLHYIEYLVNIINKNGIDPIGTFNKDEMALELRRHYMVVPDEAPHETDVAYCLRLWQVITEEIPLKDVCIPTQA